MIADGQYDEFITREHTEETAHETPGAKSLIMPNVGHAWALAESLALQP
jgi:hypothetical protein